MSTDREEPTLRFDAGEYEEVILDLILYLQYILGGIAALITVGGGYLTLNALLDSDRDATYLFGAIPFLLGLVVAVYLLNKLYVYE